MYRVYLIEDDMRFAEKFIGEALDGNILRIAGHSASYHGAYDNIREVRPDVVIIGQSDLSSAAMAAKEVSRDFGLTVILAVRPEQYDIETYRIARGSGAKNVLRKPYNARELLYAIESAKEGAQDTQVAQAAQAANRPTPWTQDKQERAATGEGLAVVLRREVIAVYSPKGGVGKSTISVSVALALKAVKSPNLSVCIVDMDTNFLSLPTILCVKPAVNIEAWQKYSADDMDYPLVESLLTKHESGVYLLPAPDLPSVVPGSETQKIVQALTRYFDIVIIDCPISVHQDGTMTALDLATKILLVTTPDVLSTKKVTDFVSAVPKLRITSTKMRLIINMLREDGIPAKEVHAAISSLPLAGAIPLEPKMAKIIYDRQLPYSLQGSPYNNAIRQLANTVVPVFTQPAHGSNRRRGFFSKIAT